MINLIMEISTKPLKGLNEVDDLFDKLKKCKDSVSREKIITKLEQKLSSIFGTEFIIDLHYLGHYTNNCAVMGVLKKGETEIQVDRGEDFVKLVTIQKIFIILGIGIVRLATPREITAIIMHEIGHMVGHLTEFMEKLRKIVQPLHGFLTMVHRIPIISGFLIPLFIITSRTLFFTQHVNEYNADKFAVEVGYGDELASVLKKFDLNESNYNKNTNIIARALYAIEDLIYGTSHPTNEKRINKILNEMKSNYLKQYPDKIVQKVLSYYSVA